jgi:hypothetical protein
MDSMCTHFVQTICDILRKVVISGGISDAENLLPQTARAREVEDIGYEFV